MRPFTNRAKWIALSAAMLMSAADVQAESPGKELYSRICQGCHMPDAQGAKGAGAYPKLATNPALASWQYIAITVINGRNAMPPFGVTPGATVKGRVALLSDAQIADVVNYVRSHFGNSYKDKVTADQISTLPHPSVPMQF